MVNIFIANLDWSITSEDLKTTFSSFGTVHYAHVVYEKETKRSKGFGYVEMESADAAISAIEALNGMEINGRAIDVKIASPKSNRPAKKAPPAKKPFGQKPKFTKTSNYRPRTEGGGGHSSQQSSTYQSTGSGEGGEVRRKLRPRRNKSDQNE